MVLPLLVSPVSQKSDSGTVAILFLSSVDHHIQQFYPAFLPILAFLFPPFLFVTVLHSQTVPFCICSTCFHFFILVLFLGSRDCADMDLCLRHGGFACNRTACISLACLHIFSTGQCVSKAVLQPSRRRESLPCQTNWVCTVDAKRHLHSRPIVVLQSSPGNGFPSHVVRLPVLSSSSSFHTCVADRIEPFAVICHTSSSPAHHHVCRIAVLPARLGRPCSFRTTRRSLCRPREGRAHHLELFHVLD